MTLKDVAARANCSVATVSKALKNSPEISEEAKERILEAARECGYLKKATSRPAVLGGARTVLVADRNFKFSERLAKINTLAKKHGLTVLYTAADREAAVSLMEQTGAWGLLVLGDTAHEQEENILCATGELTGLDDFFKWISTFRPKRAPRLKTDRADGDPSRKPQKSRPASQEKRQETPQEKPQEEQRKAKQEEIWLL